LTNNKNYQFCRKNKNKLENNEKNRHKLFVEVKIAEFTAILLQ